MAEVNLRASLSRDVGRMLYLATWALADIAANIGLQRVVRFNQFGVDSHAYWLVWHGPMYTGGPVTPTSTGPNPFLYSPAFAQLMWPGAQLPWPLFAAGFAIVDVVLLVWLLYPLGWRWVLPLGLALSPEVLFGNIFIPLAAMAVVGFRYPAAWAFSALTKVAPTVMPVWWLVRREWRQLTMWAGTTLAIAALSAALTPALWAQWVRHLAAWAAQSGRMLGSASMVPLLYRAPAGLLLVVVGAWRGRRWTVPVAALLCTPVFWLGSLAWLTAIPRLEGVGRERTARLSVSGASCDDVVG